ncbi:YdcF family protein [[Haemophilus] ducreyi]|uniref:YdcF family protein n=1 Tax=Haemophilus ducreyi TaxID=730 RepID=UPI0006560A51|nr:YdcF family protein [[Haemophilus] ducreyi]AKO45289.1 hypothetical protein RZ66_03200 [[Haemophilus] ducreyi]AKO46691.1 hypothetical protein RZ67_03180 [[Haemophilus] ducreyi]AKO48032.1 hypothetical protein RZ68_03175 [[Haemophilus] ducreyi]AKO49419.1 hypothetical protein RZ69_03210 [[Haemophilus] ducreyi]ANF61542.1 hypothetical protein A6037_01580 [[Haemophilus] ducreyi]
MFFVNKIITALVLPPFNIAMLWLISLLFAYFNYKKLSYCFTTFGIFMLYLFSTPYFATKLGNSLVIADQLSLADYQTAQAIVVLGGGIRDSQELFDPISTNSTTFERMRYAAYLQKQTGLPLLATGSAINGNSEANIMAKEFAQFFAVETTWLEENAKTTQENAQFSYEILANSNINKIILVTHQWHMQRAKKLFEQQGFKVLPASVGYGVTPNVYFDFSYFIPQSGAMDSVMQSFKEWLGYLKIKSL